MNKFFAIALSAIFIFTPGFAFAAVAPAGIPDHALWFSKDPFFEGDSITVYALLYNSSDYRLSGTLTLKDGTSTVEDKLFTVAGGGASTIVAFPWKVSGGQHAFSAQITAQEFSTETALVAGETSATSQTGVVTRFAVLHPAKKVIPVAETPTQQVPDTAESLPSIITDNLPKPVLDKAVPVFGALESYRVQNAKKDALAVQKTIAEINTQRATGAVASTVSGWDVFREGAISREVIHSPLEYAKLFFQLLLHFAVANPYVFYGLLLFIVYIIIRVIWGIFV